MEPMTELTNFYQDKMEKRESRSAIIAVGSIAGELVYPFNTDYTSSKCFNNEFSKSLKSEKIDFQNIQPSYMASNMTSSIP